MQQAPDEALVFQAEVTAIAEVTDILLKLPPGPTTFFVDSQAALRAVAKPECTSRAVWDCKELLARLLALAPVSLHWIWAHMGHFFNKEADELDNLCRISS